MPRIKKRKREGKYTHVRFRYPHRFSTIRTPEWAQKAAGSISRGAVVRMGKSRKSGRWYVESVLIPIREPSSRAYKLARKIRRKVDPTTAR